MTEQAKNTDPRTPIGRLRRLAAILKWLRNTETKPPSEWSDEYIVGLVDEAPSEFTDVPVTRSPTVVPLILTRAQRWGDGTTDGIWGSHSCPLYNLRRMHAETLYQIRKFALSRTTAHALIWHFTVQAHADAIDDAIVGTEDVIEIRRVGSFIFRDLPDGIVLGLDEQGREIARLEGAVQA